MKAMILAAIFAAIAPNRIGTQDITVMSFNMGDRTDKIEAVTEMIQKEAPLLIAIQECPSEGKCLKIDGYAKAGKGGAQIFYLKAAVKCENVAQVSDNTVLVSFRIKDSGRTFDVFNTAIAKDGADDARKILDATVAGKPSIVLGSIDANPAGTFSSDKRNPNVLLRDKYTDGRYSSISTDESATQHARGEGKTYVHDFVYYSAEFFGMHYKVIRGSYAGVKYLSDHYPVRDVIRLKE